MGYNIAADNMPDAAGFPVNNGMEITGMRESIGTSMSKQDNKLVVEINMSQLNRIHKIHWFENCGYTPPPLDIPYRQVISWQEAVQNCVSSKWEQTSLSAQNAVTEYLSFTHRTLFNECWNEIAKQGRQFVETEILPTLKEQVQRQNLDPIVTDTVKWDLVGAILEQAFLNCGIPYTFSLNLLKVYEQGNFPCGWEKGNWPIGNLIIY
jgi:hypothetical protein